MESKVFLEFDGQRAHVFTDFHHALPSIEVGQA